VNTGCLTSNGPDSRKGCRFGGTRPSREEGEDDVADVFAEFESVNIVVEELRIIARSLASPAKRSGGPFP
jgi:hypothetical protein